MPEAVIPVSDGGGNVTNAVVPITLSSPSRIMLGVSHNSFDDFVSKVGPQAAIRLYTAVQGITGSFWVQARNRAAQGVLPVVTCKRMDTSFYNTIRNEVETWDMRPVLDFFHEPEDNIEGGEFTAATYINNFRAFSNALQDVADIAWNVMAWTWNPSSGRDPLTYWPGDQYVDIVAADGYQRDDATYPFTTWPSIFDPVAAFAATHGKRFAIYEYGVESGTTQPGVTSEERAQSLRDFRAWATDRPELDMALYWESQTTNDYQFRNDPIVRAAYQEMMADPIFQRI